MKKLAVILGLLLLGATSLSARFYTTPYQFGHRWNIAFQGGALFFVGEYSESYGQNSRGWEQFTWQAGVSLGYSFTNAHEMRINVNYARPNSAGLPYGGFYPYSFRSIHGFVDYLLNFNGLAEEDQGFNPRIYVGLGAAYTWEPSAFEHPFQELREPNIVPAVRLGTVLEYDTTKGVGFFLDLGVEGFTDWYNCQEPVSFPLDIHLKATLGMIIHFPKG